MIIASKPDCDPRLSTLSPRLTIWPIILIFSGSQLPEVMIVLETDLSLESTYISNPCLVLDKTSLSSAFKFSEFLVTAGGQNSLFHSSVDSYLPFYLSQTGFRTSFLDRSSAMMLFCSRSGAIVSIASTVILGSACTSGSATARQSTSARQSTQQLRMLQIILLTVKSCKQVRLHTLQRCLKKRRAICVSEQIIILLGVGC